MKTYLVSLNPLNFLSVELKNTVDGTDDLLKKSVVNSSTTQDLSTLGRVSKKDLVGFGLGTKQIPKIGSPTMEKNLKNDKMKHLTVVAIFEDAKKPGTREGYLVANDNGDINVINVSYVKKAKKDGYVFTNMSAEKGFLVAFDDVDNIPIIQINKEEKKKTFKFYGFNPVTQSVMKLVKKDCEGTVITNNKKATFNILEEAQKLIKKPDSLFFSNIKRPNDTTVCVELIENVAKTDPQLDNISYFIGGMGLDEVNALSLIKSNLDIKITEDKPVVTTDYNKMTTYQLCLAYKTRCDHISKKTKAIKEASEILKQVCENGEVFTKGNKRVAILLGTEEGNRKFDGKAFSAAFPDKAKEYRIFGERKDDVIVDDGTKEKRTIDKTAEKDAEGKKIYKRENFTDDQLFTLAFGLNESKEILTANEYKKIDMENILVEKLSHETPTSEKQLDGKMPGTIKTFSISENSSKVLVTLKHYEHGAEGWDLNRLKFEGIYDDYTTRNKDSVSLAVLNII